MSIKENIKKYKGEANFAFSNIITSAVTMIAGVIAAANIDPEDFGVINSVLLLSTYTSFLHLGVFNGLNRNLAFYKAKGDLKRMQDCINTSHSVSYIVSLIGFLISVGVMIFFIIQNKPSIYIISAGILVTLLTLQPLTIHVECTYRSGQEFGKLANIKNFQSIIYIMLSFLPIWIAALGKLIADVIKQLLGYLLELKYIPHKSTGWGSITALKDLISAGAPLLISGYIWSVFVISDKTYIATYLTPKDMGLYTLSGYCITLFMMLPSTLNTILYPKAASKYGQTGNRKALLPFWRKSLLFFSVVIVPLAIIAYFLLPYVVEFILPKYKEGIGAAKISLLTCCTFISMGPTVIYGTLKKNVINIFMVTLCLIFFWIFTFVFPTKFTNIEEVALLRFYLSLVLMLFNIIYTYFLIKSKNYEKNFIFR